MRRVVQRLYDAVEEYLKEVDKIRSEEMKNIWTTSQEHWISTGRAEVCARIKRLLNEIVESPSLTEDGYDIIRRIEEAKNRIVDNSLSESYRGRRQDYDRLLNFEGKCADAIENEWCYAFFLGLDCKDRVTEEQIKKIRDEESDINMKLCTGTYDESRVIEEIIRKLDNGNEEIKDIEMLNRIIPRADNPHHDEIMDIIKKVYGKRNENT